VTPTALPCYTPLVPTHTPRTDITELRKARQETTAQFGQHFARSGRTIEDWEQGRRTPDRLCERILAGLKADLVQQVGQRIA